jgi:acetyl esterase/lipase
MSAARLTRVLFVFAVLAFVQVAASAAEPKKELLWPAGAPGAKGDSENDKPTLTIFLPPADQANGAAVVVCPGGGYHGLASSYEGDEIAQWLNSFGVAGFVLKYRHKGTGYQHPAPLDDAQRAIRTVRARSSEFHVDPARIGILGFSAGGHLASSAGTHFDQGKADANDAVDRAGCRPDFLVLCYPVISFVAPTTHQGSKKNLLGDNPDPKLVEQMSSELAVTSDTPPTFLWHTNADSGVPPENSVLFYLALRKAKVAAELHVFERGKHGLGLAQMEPGTKFWPELAQAWMRNRGLLERK